MRTLLVEDSVRVHCAPATVRRCPNQAGAKARERSPIRQLVVTLPACIGVSVAGAALALGFAASGAEVNDQALLNTETHKLEGIFNSELPKTENRGTVRLIVHPHFGDFTSRSYVRVPTGIRWGVSERAEVTATVEPFFEHGLKHGSVGSGIGDFEVGGKYSWKQWPSLDVDTSVGVSAFIPVGHPPLDMTTGYDRYSPYVVVGKHVASYPGLLVFCNTGVNLLAKSSVAGSFERNQPHSDSFAITPGFVYDHFPYHYTCEFGFETTSLIGRGGHSFLTVRPGFAWDLPPALTFHSTGRWLIGFGFHATIGPDGITTGGGGKVRAEFGLKRWFHQK